MVRQQWWWQQFGFGPNGNYDNGNYNDGNYNDGNYDDGNYDDGNYDDGNYDDGNYDDGNYDDGKNDSVTTIRRREQMTTGGYSCKTTRTTMKVIMFVLEFACCVRLGDHEGGIGANQVQTRWNCRVRVQNIYL